MVSESRRRKTIAAKQVEAVIGTMARILPTSVLRDDREVLIKLAARLEDDGV